MVLTPTDEQLAGVVETEGTTGVVNIIAFEKETDDTDVQLAFADVTV